MLIGTRNRTWNCHHDPNPNLTRWFVKEASLLGRPIIYVCKGLFSVGLLSSKQKLLRVGLPHSVESHRRTFLDCNTISADGTVFCGEVTYFPGLVSMELCNDCHLILLLSRYSSFTTLE